jgi:hypothetical protein
MIHDDFAEVLRRRLQAILETTSCVLADPSSIRAGSFGLLKEHDSESRIWLRRKFAAMPCTQKLTVFLQFQGRNDVFLYLFFLKSLPIV